MPKPTDRNPAFDAALARFDELPERRRKSYRLPYKDDSMTIETMPLTDLGSAAAKVVEQVAPFVEIPWDGKTITKPGTYSGISLDDYHHKPDLFDGPAVSKSTLKYIFPAHGGSPKAFWGRWAHNPNHVKPKTSDALDFGKAVHCLLLGDEVFDEKFILRPERAPDGRDWNGNNKSCRDWVKDHAHMTVITTEQLERIRLIKQDAENYPLIRDSGILDGAVERTMVYKDPETGIWIKTRPDVRPADSGIFSDLKTASKFEEDFLERQLFDHFYYGQAAMTRMVCRALGFPFDTFALVFVLNDDVPDTTHVEISSFEIDRGERAIQWALKTIRHGLDTGDWPGARLFNEGVRPLHMKPWAADRLDAFLNMESAA